MINLGIIGMNEGNGHPFSYSALFNGYDPIELQKRCPFELIKQYLPKEHRNEVFINDAVVSHIWTQDLKLSTDIAVVSKIPNIVEHYTDLIGKVDGVILARDDPWNHLEMAKPFLEANLPIFIDKQLVSTTHELELFLNLIDDEYPLMAGSSMRFTRDLQKARKNLNIADVKTVHGVSRVSWMRYGHHLLEGITSLFGVDVQWVKSLSTHPEHDIIQLQYHSGLNVILEFIEKIQLPIQFTCFSETQPAYFVPFTDYFHSFREMMLSFVELVKTGKKTIPVSEIVDIAKIVIAGDISKKSNGKKIFPADLSVGVHA